MSRPSSYDPAQPVTIHNPYPRDRWPSPDGAQLYYVASRGEYPWVAEGKVRWFNPALEESCITTKGHPFFTLDVVNGSDFGTTQTCQVSLTAPRTRDGKRKLLLVIAEQLDRRADDLEQSAKTVRVKAEAVRGEARTT